MSKDRNKSGTKLVDTKAYADGFSVGISGKGRDYFPYTMQQHLTGSDIVKKQISAWLLGFKNGQKERYEAIEQHIETLRNK